MVTLIELNKAPVFVKLIQNMLFGFSKRVIMKFPESCGVPSSPYMTPSLKGKMVILIES